MESSYTPEGAALSRIDAFGDAERIRIIDVRQYLRLKLDMLVWSCSCRHENRQQAYLAEGGDVTSERFPLVVFCPNDTRESYPNCAHVESYGRDPDPFGKEVRELVELGVLDPLSWHAWLEHMRMRILAVDTQVSSSLIQPMDGGALVPLPDGVTPEALQQPNIAELRAKGKLLVEITGRVLDLQA